jgi:hypothetical protein
MMDRRAFFRLGFAGLATVALARVALGATAPDLLTADDRRRLAAIAPALLGPALPDGLGPQVAENIAGIVRNLPAATQGELRDLLDLIGFAPARLALIGHWRDWDALTPEEIGGALEGWRSSRFALLRGAYGGLHELITAAWYGDPRAWERVGYPGPPEVPR